MSTSHWVLSSREAVPDERGISLCTTFVQSSVEFVTALADLQEESSCLISLNHLKTHGYPLWSQLSHSCTNMS